MTAQLPRPALFAIVGVVAVLGLFFMTRRGGEESLPATPAPAQPASPSTTTPATSPQANATPDKTGAPSPGKRRAGSQALPSPVAKALAAKQTVVLLIWNKRGVEDRSVKKSIDRLSPRGGKVAKFSDTVNHLARYTRITAVASVNTTPAVIVINSRNQAEVLSGYYDFQTIDEFVSNASRRK